jgi:hypothetical protein
MRIELAALAALRTAIDLVQEKREEHPRVIAAQEG